MSIRMPHNVLAGDIIHSVGTSAPAAPVTGTLWLDTSLAPPMLKVWNGSSWLMASGLTFGSSGEIMLPGAGQASIGRMTRLAGPQEDVHLRSGDASGSNATVSAASGAFLTSNCYFDGTNWQRFDVAQPSLLIMLQAGLFYVYTAVAAANPISNFVTNLLTPSSLALVRPGITQLAYYETADIHANTAFIANTWLDLTAYRNFSLSYGNSWVDIEVRFGILLFCSAQPQVGARLVVDGSYTYPLTSSVITTPAGNLVQNSLFRFPSGFFAAGVHTIWIQLFGGAAFNVYCRCASASQYEWVHYLVTEHCL